MVPVRESSTVHHRPATAPIQRSVASNWSEGLSCLTIRPSAGLTSAREIHDDTRGLPVVGEVMDYRVCIRVRVSTLAPLTRSKAGDYMIEPLIVKSLIWSAPSDKRADAQ